MTPLWILSGLALGLAGVLCTISLSHYKFPALWIAFIGTVLAVAAVFVWLHATIAEHDGDASRSGDLDKSSSSAVSVSKADSPRIPSPTPVPSPAAPVTPTPIATPTPTPIPTPTPTPQTKSDTPHVDEMTPEEVSRKLSDAHKRGTILQARKALVGVRVDGILLFWAAEFADDNQVSVFLISRKVAADAAETDLMVSFFLPMNGNERLSLTDRYVAFRTEGVITEVTAADVVHLKDVRLNRSNPSNTP
jgi:hypothetical protein